jgi:hypothetical protein
VVRVDTPRGPGERWVPRHRTVYRLGHVVAGFALLAIAAIGGGWLVAAWGVLVLVHAGPRANAHTIEADDGFVTYHSGLVDRQVPWSEIEGFDVRPHPDDDTSRDCILVFRRGLRSRPLDPGSTAWSPIARAELYDIVEWLRVWQRTRVPVDVA